MRGELCLRQDAGERKAEGREAGVDDRGKLPETLIEISWSTRMWWSQVGLLGRELVDTAQQTDTADMTALV